MDWLEKHSSPKKQKVRLHKRLEVKCRMGIKGTWYWTNIFPPQCNSRLVPKQVILCKSIFCYQSLLLLSKWQQFITDNYSILYLSTKDVKLYPLKISVKIFTHRIGENWILRWPPFSPHPVHVKGEAAYSLPPHFWDSSPYTPVPASPSPLHDTKRGGEGGSLYN